MEPCPHPFNLAAYALQAGRARPDHPALEILGPDETLTHEILTHGALTRAVQGTARAIAESTPEDARILLRIGNRPEFPIAFLGAIAAGRVPVPTAPGLTVPEISGLADLLSPALIIAQSGIALPDHPAPVMPLADLRAAQTAPALPFAMGDPNRPAYIVQTSGTSGRPRLVLHAHRAIWARRMMHDGWEGLTPDDRLLHAGALNWTFTLGTGLLDPWSLGATALIPAPDTPPDALPDLLALSRASIFAAAPGVYRKILRTPLPALPHLRHGLCAGEKLAEPLRDAWQKATGTALHEAFGQSECSTFISGSPSRPAPPGTLGFAQPGRKVELLDDNGQPSDPGQIAIHRSDPGLMLGYLGDPAPSGDWHLTGDWARRDPSGALIYEGRHDDLINAGGIRVSPLDIEAALTAHPEVHDAAACALRVGPVTEIIGAFYTGPAEPAALQDHLRAHLAPFKRPRVLERRAALPRNANQKLDRRALRREWETSHDSA